MYTGKEYDVEDGSLGEKVVQKFISTIRNSEDSICCDRFVTSAKLINTILWMCWDIHTKPQKSTFVFKDVLAMGNCHSNTVGTTQRTLKDGTKED